MDRLSIPFNVDLLILTEQAKKALQKVSSLDTFVGATKNFNPQGLYSTEIFGVVGSPNRYARFAYINLKLPIFLPTIYETLVQVKSLYAGIMSRKEYAVWDPNLKDFVRSNMAEGRTGFDFFCEHVNDIEFPTNDSESRRMAVSLLSKYRNKYLMDALLVIPAGYREYEVDDDGRETTSEINEHYYKILAISNTINESTLKASPQAYDTQRMSMQNAVMELYELFRKVIEGKNNLFMGKFAGRKVFNGTRNVLTPMAEEIVELGNPRNITVNDCLIGLYQFARSILPVTVHAMKTGWLSKCFTSVGSPVVLCNPKTLQSEMRMVSPKTYGEWIGDEGLEKQLRYFREETVRQSPILVDGSYLGLVYRGPDNTFAFIHGVEDLPSDRSPKDCLPITMADLLYYSLYRNARRYKGLVTRYPITGLGSIFPANAYLKTTIPSQERVELDTFTWRPHESAEYVAHEFPVPGAAFFNAMSAHTVRLAGLGGDHDGDMTSWTAVYSDEAIQENDLLFKSKRAYVSPDGRFIDDLDIDTVKFVLANLTGV